MSASNREKMPPVCSPTAFHSKRQPLPPEPALNIGWLLGLPMKAIDGPIHERLDEAGFGDIRPPHSRVFETVSGEGSRITDMAEEAALTKQSMQYLVDDLERLGYAER